MIDGGHTSFSSSLSAPSAGMRAYTFSTTYGGGKHTYRRAVFFVMMCLFSETNYVFCRILNRFIHG
jgi:hypothetical protein